MADHARYLQRFIDPLIDELMADLPAIMLLGPRATGKTTTAARHARSVVRLDEAAAATAFEADPDAALRRYAEPILLDEWQAVPGVLGAVKRATDTGHGAGRFILTGSVRAEWDGSNWPGTGRVIRVDMTGISMREADGLSSPSTFLDTIRAGRAESVTLPPATPDLGDYVDMALRGGFPDTMLSTSARARRRWIDSYVHHVIHRDVEWLGASRRDPELLRTYFEATALNMAGVPDHKTLYEAAGISRTTADDYDKLLRNLLVTVSVPAWWTNRLKRLIRSPKRYLADPALAVGLLGVDTQTVLSDGDLLGRVLDNFVYTQLRAELSVMDVGTRLYHLRQEGGRREIDLLIDMGAVGVIGIEIKAKAGPGREHARHLEWLRDELGDQFLAGVVLHTGPHAYQLAERIIAAPICTLWS
ncbi:ATP-binding protein [Phytoactinopolyspora endophytica]|uniref:ATP-binding protein n=1 Tax=Phytoactinopolyspora endophytica TaxID=1642495 RepID=UPI00101C0314|nr:DUF4143 domain-containing protein [Phytoactinopolyspora endophytica]